MNIKDYMYGWTAAARLVDAHRDNPRFCIMCARMLMRVNRSDTARGFFDAVMEGIG